jgi:large subunit ribosomal protein L11
MAVIKLIVDGGAMKPGPTIAQQLGPKGINIGKVIDDINKATSGFKGVKVPVELDVNEKTKSYSIHVASPPVAELLKKELGLEKGSGEAGKTKIANAGIENIINIANTKLPNMLARDLKNAVKLVLGSCVSLGILVENKSPVEVIAEVNAGKYDSEIKNVKTDVSPVKKAELHAYFTKVKAQQEAKKKAELEAAAAAEAAKAAATATATPGAAPAAGATPAPATATEAAKAPAKAEAKPEAKKK